jgi:hypothetical protein
MKLSLCLAAALVIAFLRSSSTGEGAEEAAEPETELAGTWSTSKTR